MSKLALYGVPIVAESITAYNTVAATMFSFWDFLITFNDEVELIWNSPTSWVSLLFYGIRYLTLTIRLVHLVFCTTVFGLIRISTSGCLLWVWFQVISGQVLFFIVEILLITRVFAFYGRNKIILASLLTLLAGEVSAVIALIATSLPRVRAMPSPLPANIHAGPCIAISAPIGFSSLWVPPLIFEGILFSLVLIKFVKTRMEAQSDSPPLLVVFVRDDAWAFAMIFAVALWATLTYELTDHKGETALTWHYSVLGFCGTRLILNLRSAAKNGTNLSSTYLSDIKFKTRGIVSAEGPGVDAWTVEAKS